MKLIKHRNFLKSIGYLLVFSCIAVLNFKANAQSNKDKPFPRVVKENGKYTYYVDDKPYLILGGQLWNSSAWPDVLSKEWSQLKELNCNTLEAPVYWENIEPEPGKFNFNEVDSLILGARKNDLRLIILWFGSFKNGSMSYVPTWMKEDIEKYPRMENSGGEPIQVLSVLSEENLNADKNAFVALMKHIKEIDSKDKTVIMMQVENESGSLGTDRDYSAKANEVFDQPVPTKLVSGLGKESGNWDKVFGVEAAEAFNAYHIATYINSIAKAGKEVYPLPMYTNVWTRENYFERPGEYPSGGPTSNMIPVWKVAAPELFTLALDVYHQNIESFKDRCEKYSREDNPLFIAEMGNGDVFARYQFYALADYSAIGVAPYGVDPFHLSPHDKRDKVHLDNKLQYIASNFSLFSKAMPQILKMQENGNLQCAVQEEGLREKLLHFEGYDLLFQFGFPTYKEHNDKTGRVLIGQVAEDEFVVIGFDAKFIFRPTYGSGYNKAEYVSIEDGYYNAEGNWHKVRNWNGDAAYHSTLPPDGSILKIKLQRLKTSKEMTIKPNFEK
ncbi:MAG: hypothetical protein CMO01_29745 [Thalassobius sp.]|nr:hypothetical protein [Thalassovita sp.]